jgi:hypothetical protein
MSFGSGTSNRRSNELLKPPMRLLLLLAAIWRQYGSVWQ